MCTKLYFMRHAHAQSQRDPTLVVGRSHTAPLTDEGREQARIAAQQLKGAGIGEIFSSTCVRAVETAEIVGQAIGVQPVQPSGLLVERSQGEYEGQKRDLVYTPEVIRQMRSNQLAFRAPGGESLEQVAQRLYAFLTELSRERRTQPVLLVSHLMVSWALFYLCTGCNHTVLPLLRVDNAGFCEIDMHSPDELRLQRWNERPHAREKR